MFKFRYTTAIASKYNDATNKEYKWRYAIRHSDDSFDDPITVENFVCVNRYGYLYTKDELNYEEVTGEDYSNLTPREKFNIINSIESE